MQKPVEIIVGRGQANDPVVGAADCPMPLYAGQQLYLEKAGYGTYDYDKYTQLPGGGFRLLGAGNTFTTGERFFVFFTGISFGTDVNSYSNGFNLNLVISALMSRIGWPASSQFSLNSTNTTSRGGRYFPDFHTLVTVNNLSATAEDVITDSNGMNAYLIALQKGAIMKCLNGVFKVPEFISQKLLFTRAWNSADSLISNSGKFVGAMFRMAPTQTISLRLDSVSLMFNADTFFNLYIYHEAAKLPLAVINVNSLADSQSVINLSDTVLNYMGPAAMGGAFYVGYYQRDIGGTKAYYEGYTCRSRDSYGWDFFEADEVGNYNFNRKQARITNVNYGLNFKVSTFRDHTIRILANNSLFDNAIGLTMAAMVIERIIYSTRSNGDERLLKELTSQLNAQLDLNGVAPIENGPYTTGLKKQIETEYQAIIKSFFNKPRGQVVNYAC